MRIARIIEYFPPHVGGMERHGLILSEEQIKLGHDVEIFIGVGDVSIFPNTFKAPLQFLSLYSKLRRFWFNFWAYFAVKRQHKKNPYDIIHLHGDIVEARLGVELAKKLRIPAILTIHGGLNPKILNKNSAKIFNMLDRIICVSEEIKNSLLNIGVDSSKMSIISSGVYLNEFNQPKEALGYSKPIIISIGNLTKQKGFDYLIGAFKIIRENEPAATLLIIGDGPEKSALKKAATGVNSIYFLGFIPHEEIIKFLLGADIFVLSSIIMRGYYEGAPTSLMEAMAAGFPIVATNTGGIPELIKKGKNGILVEEKNSEALAGAIAKLINDKELAGKIRKQNLEDIKQKDWPIIAEEITNVYFKI